jgi:glycosyltransferase involved in cell wall biosynthesis
MMDTGPAISVILPTHNPDAGRLARTLAALQRQVCTQPWELIVVDNASTPPLDAAQLGLASLPRARVVQERELGLTAARRRGLRESTAPVCIFVDDDNVLAADYLDAAHAIFAREPRLGCAGGKSIPEFETPPADWIREFFPLLALRDLGEKPETASGLTSSTAARHGYPRCAPIGAGMVLRRDAVESWLNNSHPTTLPDRRGAALTSAGDNDLVFSVLRAGWSVGYFPELRLTHLIPARRLDARYLARLNRGVQESWMRVLRKHDANPWPPLSPLGARLRQARAWLVYQAWRGGPEHIRWQGACGHFAGRVNS